MTGHEMYLGWSAATPKDMLLDISFPSSPPPPQCSPLGSHGAGVLRVFETCS